MLTYVPLIGMWVLGKSMGRSHKTKNVKCAKPEAEGSVPIWAAEMRNTLGSRIGLIPGMGVLGGMLTLIKVMEDDVKDKVDKGFEKVDKRVDKIEAQMDKQTVDVVRFWQTQNYETEKFCIIGCYLDLGS